MRNKCVSAIEFTGLVLILALSLKLSRLTASLLIIFRVSLVRICFLKWYLYTYDVDVVYTVEY